MAIEPDAERPSPEDEGGPVKSFLEHLEDLRWVLLKSAVAVSVAMLLCLIAGDRIVKLLMRPLEKAPMSYPGTNQVVTISFGGTRLGTYTLDARHEELFNLDPNRKSPTFSPQDIVRPEKLAVTLLDPAKKDLLSQYIAGQLSGPSRDLLHGHASGTNLPWRESLAGDLNRLIQNGPLYDSNRFANVSLSKDTKKLIEQNPQGPDLVWLNRTLLLEAYPKDLSKEHSRFFSFEAMPLSGPLATNGLPVWSFVPDTNVDAVAQAAHMNTSIATFGPAGGFYVAFQVAIYAGIGLSSPFIFYFIMGFVFPALRLKERKYVHRGLLTAVPLFLAGVSFCYFILMPVALAASQKYSNWLGFSASVWRAEEYISFVSKFMLGMGLGFELPVVILVLVKIGILDYATLSKARRYMIVINLILGAVLTTPEVLTQVLMAIPLQLLFEISVWIAWYWEWRDRKREAAQARRNDA